MLEGRSTSTGSPDEDFSDPVYWLGKHLEINFGLNLFKKDFFVPTDLQETRLYNWSPNNLSQKFRLISERAGYPSK